MKKMKKMVAFTLMVALFAVLLFPTNAQAATAKKSALKAYDKFLQKKSYVIEKENYNLSNSVFSIAYINNDSVPELLVRMDRKYGDDTLFRLVLYTYKNGKMKILHTQSIGQLGSFGNRYGYYKKKDVFFTDFTYGDYNSRAYYKISKGKAVWKQYRGTEKRTSGKPKITYENAAGKKITKTKFNQTLKKMVSSKKATWMDMRPNTASNRAKYIE